MMPSEDEKTMKTIVREISEITQELGLNIVTGHTEISDAFTNPAVTITMLGRREKIQSICSLCNIKTGMDIVMCGHAAIMGTVINVERHYSELTKRYSQDYLRTAQRMAGLMKLDKQPDIALSSGAVYTHDISSGGVYAALWELAEKAGSGIEINHDAIPIMQETIEICEFIGENPYMLDGSGAMLCVIENGNSLVEELYKQGYEAAVIGHITGGNDRIVKHDDEKRFLTPPVYSRAKGDG
jgi:hydrogenase expression/formation protein HypE